MKRCRLSAFGLVMAISVLASPIVVSGRALAAGHSDRGGHVNAELSAKASNGYRAELYSEGDKLRLTFSRGLFPGLSYIFHGKVTAEGIEARIADLGNIDLRFVPTPGKTKKGRWSSRCGKVTSRVTEGHFVGSFDFRAELGAVKLDLSRARGWVTTPAWHCPATSFKDFVESQPPGTTYTMLEAREKKRHLVFSAYTGTDAEHLEPVQGEIGAGMITMRGPVEVEHLAVTLAAHVFSFDSDLTGATVTARRPFEGQATYCSSCAPGSRWTGDLRVSLPGIPGEVALAGPTFAATLKSVDSGAADAESGGAENP